MIPFSHFVCGDSERIHERLDVAAGRGRDRYRNWTKGASSRRSLRHQLFYDDKELEMSDRIHGELILPGMLFTDDHFRALIMRQHPSGYESENNQDEAESTRIPDFRVSDGFFGDFKRLKSSARKRFSI